MRIVQATARCFTVSLCLIVIAIGLSATPLFSNGQEKATKNALDTRNFILEVICPENDGGSFQCLTDIPLAATDSTSFVNLSGASIPNSSSSVSIASSDVPTTNSGCSGDPITIIRTYTITNGEMEEFICTRTFTVEQIDPVVAVCQNIGVYLDENGQASIVPNDILDYVSTPCLEGLIDTSISLNFFNCDDLSSSIDVELTVTDVCGSSATCISFVTVVDTILPTIICPSDISITLDPCVCEAPIFYQLPEVDDNCDGYILSQIDDTGLSSGSDFPAGTTTLEYEVRDAFGNVSYCSFDIILTATDPGPINCIDSINYSLDQNCEGLVTPAMLVNNVQYCDISAYTVMLYDENGDLIPDNMVNVSHLWTSLTAELHYACFDNYCTTILNIEDKMAPQIECSNDTLTCSEMIVYPPPVVTENCGPYEITLLNETIANVSCADPEIQKLITRVYQVSDSYGNTDVCTQTLSIEKLDIEEVEGPGPDTLLYCGSDYLKDGNGNPDPSVTGAPSLNGVSLWPDPYLVCNLIVSYEDTPMFDNGCMSKTLRQWTAFAWYCGEDQMKLFNQVITVRDTVAPNFTCPANFEVFTPTLSCTAFVSLPIPEMIDSCDNGIELDIVYPGGFIDDASSEEVIDLPIGVHTIQYTVYDNCLNSSNCSFEIEVIDNVQPIVICENDVEIALGIDGMAILNAEVINGGSFDECTLESVSIARMELGCGGAEDLEFGESITVCCEDVSNDNFMVAIQVMDASGNTNQCMVAVTVIDNLEPEIISVLPDISVSCDFLFDPDNLSIFGNIVDDPNLQDDISITADVVEFSGPALDGIVMDNCDMTMIDEISEINMDNCGQGYIVRTITLTDTESNALIVEQRIDIINYFPFDPNSIVWPMNVTISNECNPSLLPLDLPQGSQEPNFTEDICDQVAATFSDDTTAYVSSGCLEITRTWYVADWCQTVNGQFLIVEQDQFISVYDDMAPSFTSGCEAPDTICSYTEDCGGLIVNLTAAASDNCDAVSSLSWTYEVDLDSDGVIEISGNSNDATSIYPVGTHTIEWFVADLCGNVDSCGFEFVIEHCGNPIPICEVGETFYVEPIDEDGDGSFDNEVVILTPADIDGGSFDPCGTDITLSFSSDTADQTLILDCDDFTQVDVNLYVTDADGYQDFCSTFIILADTNDIDICESNIVSISGELNTVSNEGLKEVILELYGSGFDSNSDSEGAYAFPPMEAGDYYELVPHKNDDITNGVTTLDLVLIQKHILGMLPLGNPYHLLAADINRSNSITASDILELQKVILGQIPAYTNNESWRFIDANYEFENPEAPWNENIPETYPFAPLASDMSVDFTAVKVGDVNGSAISNFDQSGNRSYGPAIRIYAEEGLSKSLFLGEDQSIQGLQFTLYTTGDEDLILENALESGQWFSYGVGEGVYSVMYYSKDPIDLEEDQVLFHSNLSVLDVNSALIDGIWIDGGLQDLDLEFELRKTDLIVNALLQNQPNPWSEQTAIEFSVSATQEVSFRFTDIAGNLILKKSGIYEPGVHEILITKNELNHVGVIIYELITETQRITKRMILLDH